MAATGAHGTVIGSTDDGHLLIILDGLDFVAEFPPHALHPHPGLPHPVE